MTFDELVEKVLSAGKFPVFSVQGIEELIMETVKALETESGLQIIKRN